MQRYAEVAGLRRRLIVPVPVLTPCAVRRTGSASSHRCPAAGQAAGRVAAQRGGLPRARHRRVRPGPARGAAALRRGRAAGAAAHPRGAVETRWSSAAGPARRPTRCRPTPTWAGGSLYEDARERRRAAPARGAVAGRRGHRRRERLVLLPAGLGGTRPARPAGRRGRAAPRPARPAPAVRRRVARLLAGRGDRTGPTAAAARRDARARRGLARAERAEERDGRDGAHPARGVPPAGAGRPRLLVVGRALPRHRVRRDDAQHHRCGRAGRRGAERQSPDASSSPCTTPSAASRSSASSSRSSTPASRRPGAPPALRGGPRAGEAPAADVPRAVLGRPDDLLRRARAPPPADAPRHLGGRHRASATPGCRTCSPPSPASTSTSVPAR